MIYRGTSPRTMFWGSTEGSQRAFRDFRILHLNSRKNVWRSTSKASCPWRTAKRPPPGIGIPRRMVYTPSIQAWSGSTIQHRKAAYQIVTARRTVSAISGCASDFCKGGSEE